MAKPVGCVLRRPAEDIADAAECQFLQLFGEARGISFYRQKALDLRNQRRAVERLRQARQRPVAFR